MAATFSPPFALSLSKGCTSTSHPFSLSLSKATPRPGFDRLRPNGGGKCAGFYKFSQDGGEDAKVLCPAPIRSP